MEYHGTQTQRAYKLWSWSLPNDHDDRVKCYSRSQGTNVKIIWKVLLQSLWYDVSCTAKEPTGSVAVYGQGNTSKKLTTNCLKSHCYFLQSFKHVLHRKLFKYGRLAAVD